MLVKTNPGLQVTEHALQTQILDYLQLRSIYAWRNNTGRFVLEYKGKKRFVRAGKVGSADIIGILDPYGKFLAIEVKRKGKKLTESQHAFLNAINDAGGVAFVTDSFDDFLDKMKRYA